MFRPETLRAFAAIAMVIGTAGSAVFVASNASNSPGSATVPLGTPPNYWGDRITLSNFVDVEPPTGCLPLNYATTESALRLYMGEVPEYYSGPYYYDTRTVSLDDDSAMAGAVPPGSPTYSGTNNQVAGVDEADTVKTDGWFIYTATGTKVVTARSYPASAMAVVSTIELGGYAYGIFVVGDRLAVIMQPSYAPEVYANDRFAYVPYYYNPEVEVRIYDITNRAAPHFLSNHSISGSYSGARLVGDYLYLVSDTSAYRIGEDLQLPTVSHFGVRSEVAPSSIGVPTGTHNTTYLTSVLSVNITAAGAAKTFTFLAQGGGQLYVSARNLYILGSSWEYDSQYQLVRTETVISKLSFYKGDVTCYFGARVPGTIINQFSADETSIGGHPYLRLATTTRAGDWSNTSGAVYILDERLAVVGSIEGIAPGEMVQTSRFVGERGYIVTFRRVDPLFVLDLSNPAHPSILGELTLPGFSQYLQAIDATHLIGIGVDGTATGRTSGLKLSLFDVSDPAHPFEVDGVTFGDYAYSEAQYDHHAVLYVAERGLLAIPIQTYNYAADSVNGGSWTGVIVFAVDPTTGFTEKARISHPAISQGSNYYMPYYQYMPQIRRSLYIGENLYTVSEYTIQANALDGFGLVGSVTIGAPEPIVYSYGGGAIDVTSPPTPGGTPTPL